MQINETLFRQDESGKMVPLLAEGMSVSPDALTYTITLKQGIDFSTGAPMTSKDVVFSIDAARKSLYYSGLYESIANVSAPSKFKVQIKTAKPVPAMEAILAAWVTGIVPDNYGGVTEKVFSEHPVGTGPFKVKSWKRGEALTLVRNNGYWQDGQPLLKEVVFRVMPNDLSRVAQLQGGNIDADFRPPFAQIPSLEQAGFKRKASMSISADMLLNENIPLFKNPRVREAIDLAIDRNGINQAALRGTGQVAGSFLTPVSRRLSRTSIKPSRSLRKLSRKA
jgi:peptide/nickel transport system substrate-binding protein